MTKELSCFYSPPRFRTKGRSSMGPPAEAEAIGSRRRLWQILAALAAIALTPAEAEQWGQSAREHIEYISNHAPANLRDSFHDLPSVVAVTQSTSNE